MQCKTNPVLLTKYFLFTENTFSPSIPYTSCSLHCFESGCLSKQHFLWMRKQCVVITSCQRNRWESWACKAHFRFIELKVCLCGCASWYAGSGIFRAVQDTHGWDPEALKSQDHRIIEVGRDPLRSSSPTLLLKTGSTWKVDQDHTSQDGDSIMFWATCASVGQPSQRKKCSIAYNRVFLSFSLCLLLLVQLLGTPEESLILSSLLPLLRYWYALVRSFWTSQGEESWLSQ